MSKVSNTTADTSPDAMLKLRKLAKQKTDPMQKCADQIVVATEDDYVIAAEFVNRGKAMVKWCTEITADTVSTTHLAHKAAKKLQNDLVEVPTKAWKTVDAKMGQWRREQDRIRRAKEDELRKKQKAIDEQAQLDHAEELEKAGHAEAAERVISAPAPATAVVVKTNVPKVKGYRATPKWQAKVVDEAKIPREYMTPNLPELNAAARRLTEKFNIPGVEAFDANAIIPGQE